MKFTLNLKKYNTYLLFYKLLVFLSPFSFSLISCKKDPALFEVNNLNGNKISVFGHAGMGLEFKYPIDTYESIEPVLRIGADGSEMDIQMTKDSVLMVFHNYLLEEMTICTSGLINDKLYSEISGCLIASPISNSIKLRSFNDLMTNLNSSGKNINDYNFTFDCKLYTNSTNQIAFFNQYANAILKAIDSYGLQNNILIESQDTTFLRILKNKRNGLKLFIYADNFDDGLNISKNMNLYGITINSSLITSSQIKEAHDIGYRITLWGISSEKENVEAIQKSPDFVQTDKPIHLLKVFGKYKN